LVSTVTIVDVFSVRYVEAEDSLVLFMVALVPECVLFEECAEAEEPVVHWAYSNKAKDA
jgi:hypothetical protein